MDFTGKVFIITGASSGIGAGCAIYLSKLHANLVISGRDEKNLNETAKKCEIHKNEVLQVLADLNDDKDREKIIAETIKKFGRLDVLVNNAGMAKTGFVADFGSEDYDIVMNTNIRSVFHLTQLAIPHLIKSRGNIVNISSVAGIRGAPNLTAYCMSKAALDHFTRCLSLELAPKGVRVNSVNPGVIITNFQKRAGMSDEDYEKLLLNVELSTPLKQVGNVEDTAKAIAFLASDLSSFVTGNFIVVDGGIFNIVQNGKVN